MREEVETSAPPQLSAMFQKLAMAVNTKTFDFFTEDDDVDSITKTKTLVKPTDTQMGLTLISFLFATVSSFEASYLQLQSAHSPFVEETVEAADRALVSNLEKLSDLKRFWRRRTHRQSFDLGSCLESRVQENQSKLRALGTVSNRLQGEIDGKDSLVSSLRRKLREVLKSNSKLSERLSANESEVVVLSVRVYESMLDDAVRGVKKFTRVLIGLIEKAGWDLDLVAGYVHAEKRHNRYVLLSYVCLGMFRGFDENDDDDSSLRELMQYVSSDPMELLERDKGCAFARFCDEKYHELIHPDMESSIFSNMDESEAVMSSWRSLSTFYECFVAMASSVWTLRKLALSFDPVVEIFQVESVS